MRIAVIPARGGSKRIPRKNIRDFCGKPIIAYTIEALQQSGVVDRIWVSTDDEEIAEVAKSFGAEIPFLRPVELSTDSATTLPVIVHAVKEMISRNLKAEYICCAYPTAPLVKSTKINEALELLNNHSGYVMSAVKFSYPIWRSFTVDNNNQINLIYPEKIKERSQDLPSVWHDAGQFYWASKEVWLQSVPMIEKHSKIVELPSWQVIDIDEEEDWQRAEILYEAIQRKGQNGKL